MKGQKWNERKWHYWAAKSGTAAYCRACGVHGHAVTPTTEFHCVCWKMRLPRQKEDREP